MDRRGAAIDGVRAARLGGRTAVRQNFAVREGRTLPSGRSGLRRESAWRCAEFRKDRARRRLRSANAIAAICASLARAGSAPASPRRLARGSGTSGRAFRANGPAGRRRSRAGGAIARSTPSLPRKRTMRRCTPPLALEGIRTSACASRRGRTTSRRSVTARVVARCATPGLRARCALPGRWQIHSGPSRLRQTNRNRLLRRARAVLAFANVIHLLANELSSLRRRCLALPLVAAGALQRSFFRHER
jgi:hypothetical protein